VQNLPMGRTDIADHLGLTIETVCRVLAHLRREGMVTIDRGSITIRDETALQEMASEPRH
jgi:CRP/FNR family transcriptional regulator